MTVTRPAIRIVRPAIERYTGSSTICLKLSKVNVRSIFAAELAERPEGGHQQDRQRPDVADHQPADGTGEQRPGLEPGDD